MLGNKHDVAHGDAGRKRRSAGGAGGARAISLCGRGAGDVVAVDDAAVTRAEALAMVRNQCQRFAATLCELGLACNIEAAVAELFEAEGRRLRLAMGV